MGFHFPFLNRLLLIRPSAVVLISPFSTLSADNPFYPNSFARIFQECSKNKANEPGRQAHARMIVSGFKPTVIDSTCLLLLRGLDSRLSKDLPSDLQKLRCKVAFHALRFAPHIAELGNKLSERMRSKGTYVALHLRMEKDVWVRTGRLPYDEMINNERKAHPKLLTSRSNMTYHQRKLAGLCPLNALEVARLLKALGAPKSARISWARGIPLGGEDTLLPLKTEFPNFFNKQDLALEGELKPFAKKASLMAAGVMCS